MSDNIHGRDGPEPPLRNGQAPNPGSETGDTTQQSKPSDAMDSLRQEGREIASGAKRQISDYAAEQKDLGAEQIDNVAKAVDRAADELEESSPRLARLARGAAEGTHKISETLRDNDIREIVTKVNKFAQREPVVFFSGAVLVGIALSRFLRSSEDDHQVNGTESMDSSKSGDSSRSGRVQ